MKLPNKRKEPLAYYLPKVNYCYSDKNHSQGTDDGGGRVASLGVTGRHR